VHCVPQRQESGATDLSGFTYMIRGKVDSIPYARLISEKFEY